MSRGCFPQPGGVPARVWQTQKVGAGGFVTVSDLLSDGTKLVRTDTFGAWIWNPSLASPGNAGGLGAWVQAATAVSMPASITSQSTVNYNHTGSPAVYEIRGAPTNTNHLYMHFDGVIYSSTNKGGNWVACAGWSSTGSSGASQNAEGYGPYLTVDPANENVVVAGTSTASCYQTTNGGTTFTAIAGLTVPTSNNGYHIVFDPSSSVVSGQTQGIYINSYGTGVYHSTAGVAGTFTLTTGTPTNIVKLRIDSAGVVYGSDDSTANIHKYSGGTWSSLATGVGGFLPMSFAIDPASSSNISATDSHGNFAYSTNGGTTFTATKTPARAGTDIPWLVNTTDGGTLDLASLMYDPSQSNVLYAGTGVGVFYCTPTASGSTITWTSQNAGIEQLVGTRVVTPPPGSNVLLGFYDRPVFTLTTPNKYPTTYAPSITAASLNENTGIDFVWGAGTNIFGVNCNPGAATGSSEYSTNGGGTDGGPSNWVAVPGIAQITDIAAGGGTHNVGSIATSSTSNWVICVGNGAPVGAASGMWYTTNGGTTWTSPTMTGVSATNIVGPDFGWNQRNDRLDRDILCADRINANTFYAYNYGGTAGVNTQGVWRSTNGGATWSLVNNTRFETGNDLFASHLKAMPGVASLLFYTNGARYPIGPPYASLWKSTDGGTTWAAVSGVNSVNDFGFGAPIGGSPNYTIFIYGFVGGTAQANLGVYYSTDLGSTWTQIGNVWPNNWIDQIICVGGDMSTAYRCYVGFAGSGFARYG